MPQNNSFIHVYLRFDAQRALPQGACPTGLTPLVQISAAQSWLDRTSMVKASMLAIVVFGQARAEAGYSPLL
jgi:hypothetical protein